MGFHCSEFLGFALSSFTSSIFTGYLRPIPIRIDFKELLQQFIGRVVRKQLADLGNQYCPRHSTQVPHHIWINPFVFSPHLYAFQRRPKRFHVSHRIQNHVRYSSAFESQLLLIELEPFRLFEHCSSRCTKILLSDKSRLESKISTSS